MCSRLTRRGTLKIMAGKIPFVCSDLKTRDLAVVAGPGGAWITQVDQAGYNSPGQARVALYCADGVFRDLALQLQDGAYVLAVDQNGHS